MNKHSRTISHVHLFYCLYTWLLFEGHAYLRTRLLENIEYTVIEKIKITFGYIVKCFFTFSFYLIAII